MNEVEEELPRVFQMFMRLAEIAKERSQSKEKNKGGAATSLQARSAPTPASENTRRVLKHEVLNG